MFTGPELLPHWIVGGEQVFNQLEAWSKIISTRQDFRFYFYEHQYDKHDWSKNPTSSWDSLVQARCFQLRQKYKHLALYYSGGRDSHHILRSFTKENLLIDELVLVRFSVNPVREHEYHTWILPMANRYRQINPKVKITTIDVDESVYNDYYRDGWITDRGMTSQLGYFQPSQYAWLINKYLQAPGSSTSVITGLEKPRLILEDDNVYTAILDKNLDAHIDLWHTLEYFYWAPDLPELMIKQCHMLVEYLEQHYPDTDQRFIREFVDNPHSPYYDEMCLALGRGPAVDITNPAQNGKNKYIGDHPTFDAIMQHAEQEKWVSLDRFNEMADYYQNNMSESINQDMIKGGTVGIWGKRYFVKKFQRNTASILHS